MADYWSARWRDDQIAFHEGKPNALLDRHAPRYPWTIIYVEDRDRYMAALEEASVNGDIQPFLDFIVDSVIRSQN